VTSRCESWKLLLARFDSQASTFHARRASCSPFPSTAFRALERRILTTNPPAHFTSETAHPSLSSKMARRSHSKSQSVASEANATDGVPIVNLSQAPTAVASPKKTRRRSTMSPPTSPIVAVAHPRPAPKSRVPSTLQFPLVVTLSLILSALMYSFIAEITPGDLAAISKHSESWAEVTGLLAWKVVELAIYWFGGFDGEETCIKIAGRT
jgi:hypothetical protein